MIVPFFMAVESMKMNPALHITLSPKSGLSNVRYIRYQKRS